MKKITITILALAIASNCFATYLDPDEDLYGEDEEVEQKFNKTNINLKNEKGETLLDIAAKRGKLEKVKFLLENKANPNTKDKNKLTPLTKTIILAGKNKIEIIKLLLKYKANPNLKDALPSIYFAITPYKRNKKDYTEIIKLLIENGAKVDDTVLAKAKKFGGKELEKKIIRFRNEKFKKQDFEEHVEFVIKTKL